MLCALVARGDARTATGYAGGEKVQVKVVDVGGAEVEARTGKAFRAMQKAARKAGVTLAIRSGFRTHAKQKKLYKKYRAGEGNLAAKPGYSAHESGRALDLVVTESRTYQWLVAHAAAFGFHRTVAGEPWHWEYLPGADGLTSVERGVVAPQAAVASASEYDERPCTRDWPGR
jgi:LAS superfamily LD-carboxypeptidase LdcB